MRYTTADVEAARTVEEAAAARALFKARMAELDTEAAGQMFSDEQREEFASLEDLITQATARGDEFAMRRARIEEAAKDDRAIERAGTDSRFMRTNQRSNLPDNIFELDAYRARTMGEPEAMRALLIDGAKKVVEQTWFASDLVDEDGTKARLHKLLSKPADENFDPAILARHLIGTANPLYARAFTRAIATEGKGLTTEMRAAIATVGTTTTGGYAAPPTIDTTLILTSDGQSNPLRAISRIETVTGNTWKGLTTAGVSITYGTEGSAVTADAGPVFGQPTIVARAAKGEITFSIESDEDWPGLQSEMARVLIDAKDAREAVIFVTGTGSDPYPEGVVYGLAASSHVGTGGNGFGLDDIDRLATRLPDRHEPRARFLGHRAVYAEIERLARAAGFNEPPLASGSAPTLKGYPRHNSSAMESDFVTDTNAILLFGDFSRYVIVDKVGMSIEIDPHVRDGNGKWTGQRALLAHWRNGAAVIDDNAFRVLEVGVVQS